MQSLVTFPNFLPYKKTSGFSLYIFSKEDLENILKNWDRQAKWKLCNTNFKATKTKKGYHKTAITRNKLSAPLKEYLTHGFPRRNHYSSILYHGCGKDELGLKALNTFGPTAGYDPFHPDVLYRHLPHRFFCEIHSHYTLNVVTKEEGRQIMVEIFGRLLWGGRAIISVRRDLR